MASTTMPPLNRVALVRSCHLHSLGKPFFTHPNPNRKECTHIRASFHTGAALPFHKNSQSFIPFLSIQNKAPSQTWRCSTGVPSDDWGSDLDATPSRGLASTADQSRELDSASAASLAQAENQGGQLDTASAARLAQIEKDKQKYLGRALRAGKGALIAELLQIFGHLLERPYGGGESVANAGGAVIERVVNDVQELRGKEGVSDQVLFELLKVIRLIEMDMELVRAAKKEETLLKRLETAQMHCKQGYVIASSF